MTKGVSAKHQREDRLRLRRKRLQDASGALQGAKEPVAAIPIASKPKPPVGLSIAHKYPVKRVSLGARQSIGPLSGTLPAQSGVVGSRTGRNARRRYMRAPQLLRPLHDGASSFANQGASLAIHAKRRPWRARVFVRGRDVHLGYFSSREAAIEARADAVRQFGLKLKEEARTT